MKDIDINVTIPKDKLDIFIKRNEDLFKFFSYKYKGSRSGTKMRFEKIKEIIKSNPRITSKKIHSKIIRKGITLRQINKDLSLICQEPHFNRKIENRGQKGRKFVYFYQVK